MRNVPIESYILTLGAQLVESFGKVLELVGHAALLKKELHWGSGECV